MVGGRSARRGPRLLHYSPRLHSAGLSYTLLAPPASTVISHDNTAMPGFIKCQRGLAFSPGQDQRPLSLPALALSPSLYLSPSALSLPLSLPLCTSSLSPPLSLHLSLSALSLTILYYCSSRLGDGGRQMSDRYSTRLVLVGFFALRRTLSFFPSFLSFSLVLPYLCPPYLAMSLC